MPPSRSKKRDDYYRDRRRRKVCAFCADKTVQIDYKEVNRLRRYLSERAKIEPRRKTGTCAGHQRELGGGLLIVPLLTIGFGLPLREAVGVSLVCVIVTSSAAAGVFLERRQADLR